MKQFVLFNNSNAETYWHIMEHLIAVGLENYFYTDGHSRPRAVRFVAATNLNDFKKIASTLSKRPLPVSTILEEVEAIRDEYRQDEGNPHFALKYKALFGLSYSEMLKKQMAILEAFKITAQEVAGVMALLQPLNSQSELRDIQNYIPHSVPKRYLDPSLKLKTQIIWDNNDFAFIKHCSSKSDVKTTISEFASLEESGNMAELMYHGLIERHVLITGRGQKGKIDKRLEELLKPQTLELLPPLGRPSRKQLFNEAEINLAFPD